MLNDKFFTLFFLSFIPLLLVQTKNVPILQKKFKFTFESKKKPLRLDEESQCDSKTDFWYKESDKIFCVESCPSSYNFIISETRECVSKCPSEYKIFLNNCIKECPSGATEKDSECQIECICDLFSAMDKYILSLFKLKPQGTFNHNDHIAKYIIYETTQEGKAAAALDTSTSTLDTDQCEILLKKTNGLPENEPLLVLKVDFKRKGKVCNQVEYSIYTKKGICLDLSECKDKITVYSPINQEEGIIDLEQAKLLADLGYDIFNSNDRFYNDICTPCNIYKNKDIPIEERKKDFYKQIALCEEGCEYAGINYTTLQIKCDCSVKASLNKNDNNFSIEELGNSFKNIISNSNLRVFKCYKLVFSSMLSSNAGSWIIISVILLEFIIIFFYIKLRIKPISNIIDDILSQKLGKKKRKSDTPLQEKPIIDEVNEKPKDILIPPNPPSKGSLEDTRTTKDFDANSSSKTLGKNQKTKKSKIKNSFFRHQSETQEEKGNEIKRTKRGKINPEFKKKKKNVDHVTHSKKDLFQKKQSKELCVENEAKEVLETKSKLKGQENPNGDSKAYYQNSTDKKEKISNHTDEDLNLMKYEEAIQYDKRSFLRYYYGVLKYNQLILFTFFNNSDFNYKLLKISMFFFCISMLMAFNTLFYSDETMTHTYQNDGIFDFLYSLPETIFSSVCCAVIRILLNFLSLSQSQIQEIKKEKSHKKAKKMSNRFLRCWKVKIIIFFNLILGFLFLFWYYISAFCSVYKNTQKLLILDAFISFSISMLSPFLICLIPSLFWILALRKKSKFLFNISKILRSL